MKFWPAPSKELNVDEAYLASIDERSMNFMQNVFPVAYGGNSMAFNYVTTEAELIGVAEPADL